MSLTGRELLDLARQHQLLESAHWEQLQRLEAPTFENPRALAQVLIQRGWLTPYQLNQLFQGRAADLLLGPYVILERLGEGGTGQVFKACHRRMRRVVALKLIRRELLTDAEVVNRFLREIHVVSHLTHPNVVHAYDAGPIGSTYFLAMEYVKGIDLTCLVKQSGPLTAAHACDLIGQAALGLQHAHARGLVHRDIKPPNLMLVKRQGGPSLGLVKILDLGLARLQRPVDGEKTSMLTPAGPVMMGTPDYLAPEQALNFHQADIRADIYSLGCTFYYLLTGQPPFAGGSLAQKLLMHQQAMPPALDRLRPDVPAGIAAVIRRMLAKRPEDRFQTPAEMLAALTDLHGSGRLATAVQAAGDDERTLRIGLPAQPLAAPADEERSSRSQSSTLLAVVQPLLPVSRRARLWLWGGSAVAVSLVGLALVLVGGGLTVSGREHPAQGAPHSATNPAAQPGSEWQRLLARWHAPGTDRELLRPALLRFQQSCPGTAEARQAARLCRQLSSPLDRLDGKTLPPERSQGWPSPELVAWFGEPRRATAAGCVAFSPDGRCLAMGSDDGSIHLWDLVKGTERAVLPTQRRPVRFIFTPDGQTLAVFGGADATLALWTLAGDRPQERAVLAGHVQPVRAATVTPDGKLLASAGGEGAIRLWDLTQPSAPECGRLERSADRVVALAGSPDAKTLAGLGAEGQLRLWELDRRPLRCRLAIDALGGEASLLAYHPEGTSLIAGATTNLRWYELSGNETRNLWVQKFGRVMSLAVAPDGQTVAGTVGNGRLILFDPASGAHRRVWYLPVMTHCIDFAPDGRHLAIACPGDAVAILRLATAAK